MGESEMRYELVVDNEWIYEGSYELCEEMANNYWTDPDFYGNVQIIPEDEFYGRS